MSVIRCPKCKLINNEDIRRCRKCGAPLPSKNDPNAYRPGSLNFDRAARHWAVPFVVVVAVLCIYGFYRYSQGAPKVVIQPTAEAAGTSKSIVKSVPENGDLDVVKKLHQDFVARLDQNMADRGGEGFKKNQTLASETMALLNQQQNNLNDPVAQTRLGELQRLMEKYNAQLIQYNSETLHLAEVRNQVDTEIANLQKNSSLTPEERISRKHDLNGKYFDEAQACSINSKDLDETLNSIRNLPAPGAGK
jgi:hypothetical protein